jgi:hypothetical protein
LWSGVFPGEGFEARAMRRVRTGWRTERVIGMRSFEME